MTLIEFQDCLETFALDLAESNDVGGYASAVIGLINDFRASAIQKTKEELITDMLNFVTSISKRSAK